MRLHYFWTFLAKTVWYTPNDVISGPPLAFNHHDQWSQGHQFSYLMSLFSAFTNTLCAHSHIHTLGRCEHLLITTPH